MVCSVHFLYLSVPLCVCLLAKYDGIDSSGEVSLEVSALRHPATGEFSVINKYAALDFTKIDKDNTTDHN